MSTGGIGVTVGSNSTKTIDTGQSISNVGSTVGSVLGNVSMTAGKDISLTGQNVAIVAAENQSTQTHILEQKSSGLTLALSGTVGSALNTAVTAAKETSEESNGRLGTLVSLPSLSETPYYHTGCNLLAETPNAIWCQGYNIAVLPSNTGYR